MMVSLVDDSNFEEEKQLLRAVFLQDNRADGVYWVYNYDQRYYKVLSACAKLRLRTRNLPEGNPSYIEIKGKDWAQVIGGIALEEPAAVEKTPEFVEYSFPKEETFAESPAFVSNNNDAEEDIFVEETEELEEYQQQPEYSIALEEQESSMSYIEEETGGKAGDDDQDIEQAVARLASRSDTAARQQPALSVVAASEESLTEKRRFSEQAGQNALRTREVALQSREEAVRLREDAVRSREESLQVTEEELSIAEHTILAKEKRLEERTGKLNVLKEQLDKEAAFLLAQKQEIQKLGEHIRKVSTSLLSEE